MVSWLLFLGSFAHTAEPREIKTEVLVRISVLDLTCHVIFDKSFNVCLAQAFGKYKGAVLQLLPAVIPAG